MSTSFLKKPSVKYGLILIFGGPLVYSGIVVTIFALLGREAADLFISTTAIKVGASEIVGQKLPEIPTLNVGMIGSIIGVLILIWPAVKAWRESKFQKAKGK